MSNRSFRLIQQRANAKRLADLAAHKIANDLLAAQQRAALEVARAKFDAAIASNRR